MGNDPPANPPAAPPSGEPVASVARLNAPLVPRLGWFDATMLVMGGIIGAGIFRNPANVAAIVGSPSLSMIAWALGGLIALAGAFVYAELAAWRPAAGGQYVYLRDAFHPSVAFLYGWTLLLVIQTGGMAAVAIIFAENLRELAPIEAPSSVIASITLGGLAIVNCFGARAGSNVQTALMLAKLAALAMLISLGWLGLGAGPPQDSAPVSAIVEPPSQPGSILLVLAAAMVPVIFAYGGWQTASFVGGEMRRPQRDLAVGLLAGVLGVVVIYLAVNAVCLAVLGIQGLAGTTTPAADVMRAALGPTGARLIALGIVVSTFGFLSQGMLTAPRVYYAMARDGLFFPAVGAVHPRTHAPIVAILLQGALAAGLTFWRDYGQIVDYVVSVDAIFFGLTGAALLVFRRRAQLGGERRPGAAVRVPGHPWTTLLFTLAFWALAVTTIARDPTGAGVAGLILAAGLPVYLVWRVLARRKVERPASL